GMLLATPVRDSARTVLGDAESASGKELEKILRGVEARARSLRQVEGVEEKDVSYQRLLDMRYQGQSYELSGPLRGQIITIGAIRSAIRDFHQRHQTKYGYSQPDKLVEIVNVRSYCRGKAGMIARVTSTLAREGGLPKRRRDWFMDGNSIVGHGLQ